MSTSNKVKPHELSNLPLMSEEDFFILAEMLEQLGWHKIVVKNFREPMEMMMWNVKNCKHAYEFQGPVFLFKDKSDAINFSLRWA